MLLKTVPQKFAWTVFKELSQRQFPAESSKFTKEVHSPCFCWSLICSMVNHSICQRCLNSSCVDISSERVVNGACCSLPFYTLYKKRRWGVLYLCVTKKKIKNYKKLFKHTWNKYSIRMKIVILECNLWYVQILCMYILCMAWSYIYINHFFTFKSVTV